MSRLGTLETKRAKLTVAVVALVLLAVFQVALQAKPAHAWEMKVTITGAGKVEETTPARLLNCSTSSTNPTGLTGATCFAGTPSGDYGNLWDVDYLATPASGYTFKQWESDGTTRNPIICDRSTPAATTATYSGSNTCKFRATGNLQTRVVFEDTTRPPTPTISSGPNAPVKDFANFFFGSAQDPTFKQYECRVQNKTSFQSCTSNFSLDVRGATFTDGTYTLEVRTVDHSGNASLGTATRQFTVDKTAPVTTINTGPEDGSTTQDNDPTFAFTSDESGAFACNLTGPGLTSTAFGSCSAAGVTNGTKSYSALRDGTYTFKVKANDQAGNVDLSPAERTWTINNVPTVDPASLTPPRGATNVLRDANVGATFSEEMAAVSLKNANNTSPTFKLQQYNKKTKRWMTIPATIALGLSGGKTTATLDPYGSTEGTTTERPLAGNKKFRATITTGAKDLDSNPLATKVMWTFNTGSLTG
jgi:Bacterial Ig-like domain